MSDFIQQSDYDASVHREILDSLTRNDEAIIEICEDRTIAEMRGYLAKRYDVDKIFSQTNSDRNQLVVMMAVDITVYHIFCIHNPQKLSQTRKDRYDRAKEWLKNVAKGDIDIDGAPLLPAEELAYKSPFLLRSNKKRVNHF